MNAELLAWRVGLGWWLGRHRMLLTTVRPDGQLRRSAVPYVFAGGYLFAVGESAWLDDVIVRPNATVQTNIGPKGVVGRPIIDPDEAAIAERLLGTVNRPLIVFEPSGHPSPGMAPPDLVWIWPVVFAMALGGRWIRDQ